MATTRQSFVFSPKLCSDKRLPGIIPTDFLLCSNVRCLFSGAARHISAKVSRTALRSEPALRLRDDACSGLRRERNANCSAADSFVFVSVRDVLREW